MIATLKDRTDFGEKPEIDTEGGRPRFGQVSVQMFVIFFPPRFNRWA